LTHFQIPYPLAKVRVKRHFVWNSVDGKIYVSVNGREEMLFADSLRGSQDANLIQAGSHYEFRLYNANHKELLAKVVVTRGAHTHGS
jgi:hypothetical protein